MFQHELGRKAKDQITGFEGILVARCEHLYGCNTYGVAPKLNKKDGKRGEVEWFDEGRLIVTGKGIKPEKVRVQDPGAEYNDHPNVK